MTKTEKTQKTIMSQPLVIVVAVLLAVAAIWFFAPYFGVICLSALMAYVFFPLYKFLRKRMPDMFASWTVLIVHILIVLIPVFYVGVVVVQQGFALADTLSNIDTSAGSKFSEAASRVSAIGQAMGLPADRGAIANTTSIVDFVKVTIPSLVKFGAQAILTLVASAPALVTSSIIYAFLFSAFLRYHKQVGKYVDNISPFNANTTALYLKNSGMMVTASLKGQLVISFVTALLSSILMIFLGYEAYFWLFLILFTVLGMVPLGSGIVVIPLCLVSMLVGDFWASFWVLAVYLLVICNLDSLMRPKLIPKEAGIVPALAVLVTFCGLFYFGILGVVYGPLIVILLSTTANLLIQHKKQILS